MAKISLSEEKEIQPSPQWATGRPDGVLTLARGTSIDTSTTSDSILEVSSFGSWIGPDGKNPWKRRTKDQNISSEEEKIQPMHAEPLGTTMGFSSLPRDRDGQTIAR